MNPANMTYSNPTLTASSTRMNRSMNSANRGGGMRRAFNPANSNSMAAQTQGEFGGCCIGSVIACCTSPIWVPALGWVLKKLGVFKRMFK